MKARLAVIAAAVVAIAALLATHAHAHMRAPGPTPKGVANRPQKQAAARTDTAASPMINVFIIPHSHDDAGWQRTVDQYYHEYVRYILDGVVERLMENRNRTFVEVEIAFFARWWANQPDTVKANVKTLVANDQLEFLNGGWVMADEGATTFEGVVDQLTLGAQFLQKELGVTPKIGWSIDPFGASASFAAMFADMGYDAFVINRIDYQLKSAWQTSQGLEFTWRGTTSRGDSADIFTHVLDSHYSAPYGFDWEYFNPGDSNSFDLADANPPLYTDPASPLDHPTLADQAQAFVQEMQLRASYFLTPNVLVPFGDDFKFVNSKVQYENMELLMQYINDRSATLGVRLQYGTVSQYLAAVKATKTQFPVYEYDFFPYSFAPSGARFDIPGWASADSFWSGYYTSRPQLKGYERAFDGLLHAVEVAHGVAANSFATYNTSAPQFQQMRAASGVLKHHDAVTGTSVPYVVADYLNRLAAGRKLAHANLADDINAISSLLRGAPTSDLALTFNTSSLIHMCAGNTVPVVLYNPLAQQRRELVRIPVTCSDIAVTIVSATGQTMPVLSQVNPNRTATFPTIQPSPAAAPAPPPLPPAPVSPFNLYMVVDIPAAGFATVFLTGNAAPSELGYAAQGVVESTTGSVTVSNGQVSFTVDATTGQVATIDWQGQSVTVQQEFLAYTSETHWPDSTPYVFRPDSTETANPIVPTPPVLALISGPVIKELHQTFYTTVNATAWVHQTLTLVNDSSMPALTEVLSPAQYIHVSMVVGMPGTDRELVTRFSTSLNNTEVTPSTWPQPSWAIYTDANTQEMKRRITNWPLWATYVDSPYFIEPVAMNYYPAPSASYLQDTASQMRIGFVTDRSHGAACLALGQLEVMMHRRNAITDGISLDDTSIVNPEQGLFVAPNAQGDAAFLQRRIERTLSHPVVPIFGVNTAAPTSSISVSQWLTAHSSSASFLADALPPNVDWQSLNVQLDAPNQVILRLRHLFGVGEHPMWSTNATVDLATFFNPKLVTLVSLQEVTLNAITPISDVQIMLGADSQTIQLSPLQTRTFIATLKAAN